MRIGVLFVGELADRGFNASAFAGAKAAMEAGHRIEILSGIAYNPAEMTAAVERGLHGLDGLVFVGGQGDRVVPEIARRHPGKLFALVQGNHIAPNVASYDVLQEQSAFLGGYLAARMTQTGTVAHLSGHRVRPGLKGRAAFAGGVRHAAAGVRLLTAFCGTQDANDTTRRWADAQIAAGADILFTMLNGARDGAIEACAGRARQIGNALDWCRIRPDIFLASAEARIDLGVLQAITDMEAGALPAKVRAFGLSNGGAVHLTMGADVPAALVREIEELSGRIARGEVEVPESYDGPEFALEHDDA
ncbi:BMP family lipoprotein [Frigidibacter mobilis]|uniref:Basic membrane lipoprotein n=1 Tax=Frigidibacter mobilis TaxID=1335048 RepID=A0A159Z2B8_9RHOB|nr:BMP family ABC transporter substrate-binding protein [Frigidibacter mobilis]AMY68268.1 basic membrane lipoprotein [Frigidibacter mobilis]